MNERHSATLAHLPAPVRTQLDLVLDLIHQAFGDQVAMTWLFGSYARGDFIDDRHINEQGALSTYQSDIDLLLVLDTPLPPGKTNQNERTLKKLAARVEKLNHALHDHPDIHHSIHLIHETLERFNQALKHSEYFYLDVVNEGIALVDQAKQKVEPQQMPAHKRREYGIRYFETLFEQILEFQQSFEFHYQRGHKALAMFNLHQVTENLFKVFLLVTTHYKPRTHKLWALKDSARQIDERVTGFFPRTTQAEKDEFSLLNSAYVDARYLPEYSIQAPQLDTIAERVQAFEHWVFKTCLTTLDQFVPDAPYSPEYTLAYPLLDMQKVKSQLLPENIIQKQEQLLQQKEQDLANAKASEAKAQAELAKLKQKLRDAGLD